jgi:hypothetical protein
VFDLAERFERGLLAQYHPSISFEAT